MANKARPGALASTDQQPTFPLRQQEKAEAANGCPRPGRFLKEDEDASTEYVAMSSRRILNDDNDPDDSSEPVEPVVPRIASAAADIRMSITDAYAVSEKTPPVPLPFTAHSVMVDNDH